MIIFASGLDWDQAWRNVKIKAQAIIKASSPTLKMQMQA